MQAPRIQCELAGEQVDLIAIRKHDLIVMLVCSLRLLGIAFMVGMKTSSVVREMHGFAFG